MTPQTRTAAAAMRPRSHHDRAGFTLVELLVVVGIIALLVGILLPTLSGARKAAARIKTATALREMLVGYTMYHQEHHGALPWGYAPATVNGVPLTVHSSSSGHTFGWLIADRYPWRLAPYVSELWSLIHLHSEMPDMPLRSDPQDVAETKAYILSLNPTFGINSVYLGGHRGPLYQGFVGANGDEPNTGRHVAFHTSEIRDASRLIVFAECQARNAPALGPDTGLHFLTPPRANGLRWTVHARGEFQITTGEIVGLPIGRYGDRAAVGFFDGHVEMLAPRELTDMRLWAPRAASADYDFVP